MCAKFVFENAWIGFIRAINATLLCPHTWTNVHVCKGGATNLKVGGQCIKKWGGNTVKTLTLKKSGECMTPPFPMVAPPLHVSLLDMGFTRIMSVHNFFFPSQALNTGSKTRCVCWDDTWTVKSINNKNSKDQSTHFEMYSKLTRFN